MYSYENDKSQNKLKRNNTGLPDNLKTGIEALSGFSLDDVKVNYNSTRPAQFKAHAYTKGAEIHVAPGQEKHLPHEAWHVVQQKRGRVSPTVMINGVNVNTEKALENEADIMGARALQGRFINTNDLTYKQTAGDCKDRS
ncbi:MAG: DUF4157 domain-containing protein [Acetatifactor sp.]|nr:DUF4157 domain-containing protein [Acetatifactor sp.]